MHDYFSEKLALRGRVIEDLYFARIDRELIDRRRIQRTAGVSSCSAAPGQNTVSHGCSVSHGVSHSYSLPADPDQGDSQ
jgi:hypothetical protein